MFNQEPRRYVIPSYDNDEGQVSDEMQRVLERHDRESLENRRWEGADDGIDGVDYIHFRVRRLVLLAEYLLPCIGLSDEEVDQAIKARYVTGAAKQAAWDALTSRPLPDPALTGRQRAVTARDRRSQQELAQRCHAWEAHHPQRIALAAEVVRQSTYEDYFFPTWCLHYGYDPITQERIHRIKDPKDIVRMLDQHKLLSQFDIGRAIYRGITPKHAMLRTILSGYHYVARLVNQWVRVELLYDVAQKDPQFAHALLRQWMKDATFNDD